ncbi:hypothetical protein PLESTB_001715200 [Pleodorina starrii]|uniref:Uncharacterized protein n=1 Tax=Pleodorina starrii TaxID=330485 RepID=A0A9W6BZF6_9CHLO|nr:hypothetical protein PLESTM_000791300 [Pleodorina starrii]GLC61088.1 hypothetical protein PLESTB_001715200 [Pleodorina starrii]GLC75888.1 hypothetical protein PLESTF_001700700 [Pleodorina starrii]
MSELVFGSVDDAMVVDLLRAAAEEQPTVPGPSKTTVDQEVQTAPLDPETLLDFVSDEVVVARAATCLGRIVAATATAAAGAHVAAETHVNNAAVRENAAAATRVHSAAAAAIRADAAAGVAPMATDTDEEVEEEDAAAKRRRVDGAAGPSSAAGTPTAAAARPSSDFQEVRRKKSASRRASLAAAAATPPPPPPTGSRTKFGCRMSIYLWRKEHNRCLACGEPDHGVSECTNPAWLRRKAENDAAAAAAAAAGGSGDGKAKGKCGNNRGKGN